LLVEQLAPEASGSGIPQVKANLANVPIKLSWRVGSIKLLTAMIALGSGLTLGRQGPTVHVGAAVAAGISRWVPTSPDHRRQMIAAGAGAGLAAAFNAPIAGVLFVVEELLQDVSGLTLGTAIIASFLGAVVSRVLGGHSLQLNLELTAHSTSFSLTELPFFLVVGILAGLLGSLFNRGLIASLKFYRQLHLSLALRVGLAGFVSGVVMALLPASFRDNTGLREFLITGDASWYLAAIAFVSQFILTLVAFGSGAPGGLFAPSLILGSALGYLVGVGENNLTGIGSPTTYALTGMGAFFSVVSKVPITAIVIVFEMTTDFNLVLPLMIGSVTAYLVGESIAPGSLYNEILQLKGIYLEKEPAAKGLLAELTARDVMQRRVETLGVQMTLDEAVQAFSRSHHRGFPVVDDGKLVGIVTQTDLVKMRDRHLSGDNPLSEIMTPQPVTVAPTASLGNVLYLLDRYKLSRLPVIEGRKLIGIITRADIIRAEADKLNCETGQIGPRPEPSYVVYQTRSPSIGQGRLLVPLANPQTAASLLQFAIAIARDRHYELECIQVILVPRHTSPAETQVKTTKSRRLLRQAEILGRQWQIPVHTQIRVAHDAAQAILEAINERHIDLILMGWKGNTITPGRIFGSVVDTVIRQAACNVVLVKLAERSGDRRQKTGDRRQKTEEFPISLARPAPTPQFNRWLVPMAGGPNSQAAIHLLPALVTIGDAPSIRLCQVFQPSEVAADITILEQATRYLIRRRNFSSPVTAAAVRASSVSEGVINLVKTNHFDVVVLGASREGLLQQAIKGNIPAAIASRVESTVILVRGAIGKE
jgi:CIC family chloride channel protein